MKDNIVNLEEEYLKKKNAEAFGYLMNRQFEKTIEVLKEPLAKIKGPMIENKYCPQNIFESGIILNFLNKKVEQKDFAKINYYDFFLMSGSAKYNLGQYDESRKDYQTALELNPASAVARLQVQEINKIQKQYDDFLDDVRELLRLAYRRADIARGYRNIGFYLYDKKDYEMALVSYFLSNVYDMSELATNEIKHIGESKGIDLNSKAWLSEEMLREFSNKYNITLTPNDKIVTFALAMAEDANKKKAFKVEKFAYQVAYELTLEEEYKKKYKEIKE